MVFNSRDHRTNSFGNVEVIFCPESIDINFSLLFLMIPSSFLSFPGRLLRALTVLLEAKRKSSFVSIERRFTCHQSLGAPFFICGCCPSRCYEALLTLGEHFGVVANSIVDSGGSFQSRWRSILWASKQIAIFFKVDSIFNEDYPSLLEERQEFVVYSLMLFPKHLKLLLLFFGHLIVRNFELIYGQFCHR